MKREQELLRCVAEERPGLPPVALLAPLLKAAGHEVAEPRLSAALDALPAPFVATQAPADWVRSVANHAQLKGVSVLQLVWRRFDQRRLPALVWMEGAWELALGHAPGEDGEEGDPVRVRDALGVERIVPQQQLQDHKSLL